MPLSGRGGEMKRAARGKGDGKEGRESAMGFDKGGGRSETARVCAFCK